jgi:hypothetical protein
MYFIVPAHLQGENNGFFSGSSPSSDKHILHMTLRLFYELDFLMIKVYIPFFGSSLSLGIISGEY